MGIVLAAIALAVIVWLIAPSLFWLAIVLILFALLWAFMSRGRWYAPPAGPGGTAGRRNYWW